MIMAKSWRPRIMVIHGGHGNNPGRHHGMIKTMFRHDHGKMMAWRPFFSSSGAMKIRKSKISGNPLRCINFPKIIEICIKLHS